MDAWFVGLHCFLRYHHSHVTVLCMRRILNCMLQNVNACNGLRPEVCKIDRMSLWSLWSSVQMVNPKSLWLHDKQTSFAATVSEQTASGHCGHWAVERRVPRFKQSVERQVGLWLKQLRLPFSWPGRWRITCSPCQCWCPIIVCDRQELQRWVMLDYVQKISRNKWQDAYHGYMHVYATSMIEQRR